MTAAQLEPAGAPRQGADRISVVTDLDSGTTQAPRAKKVRDPWLDNARVVACVLVVVGHFLVAVDERSRIAALTWAGLWAFRIPLYVVVAGMFTSAEPMNRVRFRALVRDVLVVYLVFDFIEWAQAEVNGQSATYDPMAPDFGLWFLLALFFWRLVLPVVAKVPGLIWWAIGLSIVGGFLTFLDTDLSLGRAVALFPLFVLGWKLQSTDVRAVLGKSWVRAGALVLAGGLALALAIGSHEKVLKHEDFLMRLPYKGDWSTQFEHAGARALLLAAAVLGALAVLSLVPRKRIPFLTIVGASSMFVYLLHLLVVRQLNWAGAFDGINSYAELAIMMLAAVGLALLLATPPVRWLTRPLIQPRTLKGSWLDVRTAGIRARLAGRVG